MTPKPDAPLPWKDHPRNQCARCGKDFANLEGFEVHRLGEPGQRRCLTQRELERRGYALDERGLWFNVKRRERTRQSFAGPPAESSEPLAEGAKLGVMAG
jgi:hypothetical protein